VLLKFKKHIETSFSELLKEPFLIACSGGIDSVVLTHLCHNTNLQFAIAHCNFRLRGEESDIDENFVKEITAKINRKFYVTHFDTVGYVHEHRVSVQMAARELRYAWFSKILKEQKISYILTAHHANDNLETFLINLSRGTGIDGLSGIPSKMNSVLRPLLPFTRKEIEAYAISENLKWREDASNGDVKYLRNKIRLEIIPKLTELHPTFLENFQNTQSYLNQTQAIALNYLDRLKMELFQLENDSYKIAIGSLLKLVPLEAFLFGLFKEYGFTEWQNVHHLVYAMSGKKIFSNSHVLLKDRDFLWLYPINAKIEKKKIFHIHTDFDTSYLPINIKFKSVTKRADNTKNEIFVQKDTLKFP